MVAVGSAAAQGDAQLSVAETCFEHHKFGAQPVDVAKSADGETVLAQTSWNWHDAIGCYLTLDDDALAALRAAPAPQSLPDAATEASQRCFVHHSFGEKPVDVAKSADRQTVLARLSWGYHNAIGCYLTLDDTALTTLRAAATSTQPQPSENTFIAISTGDGHSCAITGQGQAVCWGANQSGQTDAPDGTYTAISTGDGHSCAITGQGQAVCWGAIPTNQMDVPHGTFTAISAGNHLSCAITDQGQAVCWGYPPPSDDPGPEYQTDVPDGTYTAASAGDIHSCAITGQGQAVCWGYPSIAYVPDGAYAAISAGPTHSCAVTDQGQAVCWGPNWGGVEGLTEAPDGTYTAISAGPTHSCAITDQGQAVCWGANDFGQTDVPDGT